jgi:predicted transcriptional regulator
MTNPKDIERLAEIIWDGRKRAVGDDDDAQPFAGASSRIRTQYMRQAEEVAKLLAQDRAKEAPADLRTAMAEAIATWQMRHAVVCEHTQMIEYGRAADAVLAIRDGEMDRLRAELAECKRLSTSPMRDEATGLETLCALLHASGAADPNVIKDVAWRTFNLIRAFREQGTELDQLAEQMKQSRDIDLIRRAISDPGQFTERKRFNDDGYESLPAWSARAVIRALDIAATNAAPATQQASARTLDGGT